MAMAALGGDATWPGRHSVWVITRCSPVCPVLAAHALRTPGKNQTLNPVWTERNGADWRDVNLPLETLAVRVRVFDADLLDEDDPLGECVLPIAELDPNSGKKKYPENTARSLAFREQRENSSWFPRQRATEQVLGRLRAF